MGLKPLMKRAMFSMMGLPTCEEVEQFAYDFLEGSLDPKTKRQVEWHLKACRNCKRFISAYRKIRGLGPTLERPPLDPEFKENIVRFLIQKRAK